MAKNTYFKVIIAVMLLGLVFLGGHSYGTYTSIKLSNLSTKASNLHEGDLFLRVVEQLDRGETSRIRRNLIEITRARLNDLSEIDQANQRVRWYEYAVPSATYYELKKQLEDNNRVSEERLREKFEAINNRSR